MVKKNGVGLCLSGGGARGFFHIGVIEALRKIGINITEISGCSVGAIIGGIYASNPCVDFYDIVNDFKFAKILRFSSHSGIINGVVDSKKFDAFLKKNIKARSFESLKLPLTINATDMHTAKEIIFRKGPLIPAITASCTVPGLFPLIKDHTARNKTRYICDGGLVNLIPVSHLKSKKIIVSDLKFPLVMPGKKPKKSEIMKASLYIPLNHQVNMELEKVKDKQIIQIKLDQQIEMLDFRKKHIQDVLMDGFDKTLASKKKILKLIES